jgi:outer membrane biosynthesis protein TonB
VNRTGLPQGQERTVSYQPEERYWTDYLRIALPVVGLLLMLGLFWYWASAVIGDDNENEPQTQPTNQVALITEEVPTPTQRPDVVINPETTTPEPTPEPTRDSGAEATDEPTEEADETPDEEAPGAGFREGDLVVTNTGDVNLRVEPSTSADIVDQLAEGTELEVLAEADEADGFFWLHVTVAESGQEGYIADEFVEPAE